MKKSPQDISAETTGRKSPGTENWFMKDAAVGTALTILLFFAIGFFIYSHTFNSPFVFDDELRILENYDIRLENLTIDGLLKAAFGKRTGRTRPIGSISFALNYYFHQYELAGYHIINIIIHIITGILLWLILKRTLNLKSMRSEFEHHEWIALFAALLWLVNPVQTQSVTYIVQRYTSMAAMFCLFSFLFYLNGRLTALKGIRWAWFSVAALAWLLALGCKENTAILPFIIFLYEWYFFQDLSKKWLKKQLKFVAAIVVAVGIIAWIYLGMDPWEKLTRLRDFSEGQFTLGQRLLTQTRVVIYYLSLIIVPHPFRLNLDYDFPLSHSLTDPFTTLLSSIGIIGLIILAVLLANKQRLLSFCIVWFLGNLVIESSVIPLAIIFEHRLYLPSMLVGLIPAVLLYRYIQPKWLIAAIGCALIIIYAYWTFERNYVWRDHLTLWADCVKKSPNKARAYAPLGAAQKKLNMLDEAFETFRKALELNPDFVEALHNMGVMLEDQNRINQAIAHYRRAVELEPSYLKSRNNLGVALLKTDKTDEAIAHFLIARQIEPRYAQTHYNLGLALAKEGRIEPAVESLVAALKLDPNNPNIHVKLGDVLLMQGKPEQATKHFQTALQLNPQSAEAHLFMGSQLLNQDKRDQALAHLKQALRINPQLAQAHNNVGIIMIREKNLEAAIYHFQKAVQIDPNFAMADKNLQKALAIQKNLDQDPATIQKALKDDPDNPVLHYKMGNVYLGERKLRQAIIEFERALALQPEFIAAQNNLAMAYAADRQYDRALAAFKKLIALDPGNAGSYYNVAVLYALQDNVPDSIAWLKLAIERGYQNWEMIKTDKDLANIRSSQDYQQLVKDR